MDPTMSPKSEHEHVWSVDKMRAALEHRDEDVRHWAASHILEWHPEAQAQVLPLLPQASASMVFRLLDSLKDLPLLESSVGPLREFLKGKARPAERALAAALLIRSGRTLPPEDLAGLPMANCADVLAPAAGGHQCLKREYDRARDAREKAGAIRGLAAGCASRDLFAVIIDENDKDKKSSLKHFEKLWERVLPDVHKVRDLDKAKRLLEEAMSATGPEDSGNLGPFPVLSAELDLVRERCRTLLEASGVSSQEREDPTPEVSLLLACALALYRDDACRRGLRKAQTPADLWNAITLRPWWGEVDPEVVAFLREQREGNILASLGQALNRPWAYGEYAFQCLIAAGVPGSHQMVLEAMEAGRGESIVEDAFQALRRAGPALETAALEHWGQVPPPVSSLLVLEYLPTRAIVEFLLGRFQHYLTSLDPGPFVELLGEIAAQDFLEPLVAEWRPGEIALGRTIKRLSLLHNVRTPRVEQVIRDTNQHSQPVVDPSKIKTKDLLEHPPPVPLRCTNCGRTYHYQIEKVFLNSKTKSMVIQDMVECKGCGSIETYEEVPETRLAQTARLLLYLTAAEEERKKGKKDPPRELMPPLVKGLGVAGREFKDLPEAYHFLRKELERRPTDADLQARVRIACVIAAWHASPLAGETPALPGRGCFHPRWRPDKGMGSSSENSLHHRSLARLGAGRRDAGAPRQKLFPSAVATQRGMGSFTKMNSLADGILKPQAGSLT